MNPMDPFDAIFGPINPVSRLLGVLSATKNGSYCSAANRDGMVGVVSEASSNIIGLNSFRFAFSRRSEHTLESIHNLLGKYGVHTFSYLHDHENFYFNVRRSQARWAEYVLLRAGVELEGQLFDSRNAEYRNNHTPGTMPVPWSENVSYLPGQTRTFASSLLSSLKGNDKVKSIKFPPKGNNLALQEQASEYQNIPQTSRQPMMHRKSVPARKPGGWLDQLDAFLDRLLEL